MAATMVKSTVLSATTADQAATVLGLPSPGEWAVQLAGTWSGTVTFEATVNNSNWVSFELNPTTDLSDTTSSLTATATANGVWTGATRGVSGVRARFSTASSGTVEMTVRYAAY